MSVAYIIGFAVGILFVALVADKAFRKKDAVGAKYDERQMMGRGIAFRNGFFTLLCGGLFISILEYWNMLPGEPFLWHFGASMLGVGVFALTAIFKDAYVGMTESPKRFVIFGCVLTAWLVISGVTNLCADEQFNTFSGWMDIIIAVVWVAILAALLIHNHGWKGLTAEDTEDDGE